MQKLGFAKIVTSSIGPLPEEGGVSIKLSEEELIKRTLAKVRGALEHDGVKIFKLSSSEFLDQLERRAPEPFSLVSERTWIESLAVMKGAGIRLFSRK